MGEAAGWGVCGGGAEGGRFGLVVLRGVEDVVVEAGGLALLLEFLHGGLTKFYDIIIAFLLSFHGKILTSRGEGGFVWERDMG